MPPGPFQLGPCRVWPLGGPVALRVEGEAPALADAWARRVADDAWERTLRTNPRAHDGALLTLDGVDWTDAGGVTLRARRDAYRFFAVDDDVRRARGHAPATPTPGVRETPVTCLGVSGVIVARTPAPGTPAPRVLMGRRGEGTRVYGGQWETAPRGTVSPPSEPSPGADGAASALGADALERQLLEELIEETALAIGPALALRPVALVHDALARSVDVVYLIHADDAVAGAPRVSAEWGAMLDDAASATGWEYPALRWRPWGFWRGAGDGLAGEATPLSPPTAAFFGAADRWGLVRAD